jgi:hypothetical protein
MDRIGDYIVERELGRTASETLYEGVHVLLPRRARVRVAATPADMVRESRVLEALRHPAVPRMFECGILPDKRGWLASELVVGPAVHELVLSVAEVVALVRDVADVLAHAHARYIVHGNLRAEVIVRAARGTCVIGWADARVHVLDGRADIRALGAIANHALFGRVPTQVATLIARMLSEQPPPATQVRDDAARIAADLEAYDGIEDVELVELRDDDIEDIVPRMRPPRWTPPTGYAPPPHVRVIARARR